MVPFRIPEPLTSGDNEENCWLSSQSEAIIGTADFIGINYYSLCPKISVSTLEQGWREYYSIYASNCPLDKSVRDYTADMSISYKSKHHCFTVHNFVAAVVGSVIYLSADNREFRLYKLTSNSSGF